MKRKTKLSVFAAGILFAGVLPLVAHHSAATEFDMNDPVSVEGVVSKVEWRNPHIWYYVDVADENGNVTTWGFTGGPPGMLARRGITKNVLELGTEIKVSGFRARDGSNNAAGRDVTFLDGRSVFVASPGEFPEGR